jgi:hypothetical protein
MILAELWSLPTSYFQSPAMLVLALMGLGFVIGNLTGIFGVGGGFLVSPLLMTVYGLPPTVAVGSDVCYIIGSSASGLRRHGRLGNWEPTTTLLMAIGAVGGTLVGKWIQELVKAATTSGVADAAQGSQSFKTAMQILYLPLLIGTAILVWRGGAREGTQRSLLQKLPLGPRVDLRRASRPDTSLPGLLLVGFSVGILTGLLGVGGGVLFMPILLLVVGLTPHQAVGTSLGVVLFSSTTATVRYGLAGEVNLPVAMCLLVTSTIGIQIGAKICHKLHGDRLRKYFALVVLGAIAVLLLDLLKILPQHH